MQEIKQWQCRVAPSLGGGFAGTVGSAWGVSNYDDGFVHNIEAPCVFFGLYGLPDFYALWRHKGKKAILWCGTDVTHFADGYWLDDTGRIKIPPAPLAKWISEKCDNYVENQVEYEALKKLGIRATVMPSFLGNVNDYQVSYEWKERPSVYTSVSGDNYELYGLNELSGLAFKYPWCDFHVYGSDKWSWDRSNVFVHSRVSQEQMNAETKKMQGALRLTRFEGFSEILAKSLLWGQWPVSPHISYPHILTDLDFMRDKKNPNMAGREWLLKNVNKFPWNHA